MKILLDTYTLIWALGAPEKMPEYIVEMICNESNDIYVSAASLWEISIKNKKSPEKMPFTATQIRDYCQRAGYYFLSLSIDSVATFDKLSFKNNNDPFDQILVSQSIANNMRFLTHDEKIKQFGLGNIEFF
ncbi:MAG: type II toxin-antitoxin system VapC family toxin [Bacilli bacterium]|nr:type II toxin-antitoxin system VapC family toxin [Bacilli bacterium]